MLFTPTYGGVPIFGLAVRIEEVPGQASQQLEAFFGVGGLLSVFGGTRGRRFNVSGVLFDVDLPTLNDDEALFMSFQDGIARVLSDTRGRDWPNVVYLGEFEPDPMGPRPAEWGFGGGWALPYRAVFHGLS
jgi:hypothetical protein